MILSNKKPFKGLFGSNLRRVCKKILTMTKVSDFLENDLVFKEKPKGGRFQDLEGQKFGRLTVLGLADKIKQGNSVWHCKCECGNQRVVLSNNLKRGHTMSCGCFNIQKVKEAQTTHGHTVNNKRSKVYCIWREMNRRCSDPKRECYPDYGGRGIKVCDRWLKFENFLADMGNPPHGMSIDRKDNNKGYYKENCRWATRKEQNNNTRRNHLLTLNGRTQTVAQWSEETGIMGPTIRYRLKKLGWTVERALTT